MGKDIAASLRAIKLRWVVGALLLALVVKLIWFEPVLTPEAALDTAKWQLKRASEEMRFDLSQFGEPEFVVGNSTDGYLVTWTFLSESNTSLRVSVLVAPLDVDFGGAPFILDCRGGPDNETRQAGFGYLCNDRGRDSVQLGP